MESEYPMGRGHPWLRGFIVSGWIVNLFPYLLSAYSGLYLNKANLLSSHLSKEVVHASFPFGMWVAPYGFCI